MANGLKNTAGERAQEGDLIPNLGVIRPDRRFEDVRDIGTRIPEPPLQAPAIVSSRQAREELKRIDARLRELNRRFQIPPIEPAPQEEEPKERQTRQGGLTAEEMKEFGGDLSGFGFDEMSQKFFPQAPEAREKTEMAEKRRLRQNEFDSVNRTFLRLRNRVRPGMVPMIDSIGSILQRRIELLNRIER